MILSLMWITVALFIIGCQNEVNSFEDCVKAGNPILESYPEQCHHDGKTYTRDISEEIELKKFQSEEEFLDAFKDAKKRGFLGYIDEAVMAVESVASATVFKSIQSISSSDFSTTNIQVQGVDEADIIKTDGSYIYAIANGKLIIAKAHPNAKILSETKLDLEPQELFIYRNKLMIFGHSYNQLIDEYDVPEGELRKIAHSRRSFSAVTVKLFDISDKDEPKVLRTVDFEGNYLTSRMIDDDVYFVVNSYPYNWREEPTCGTIIPQYREDSDSFKPSVGCTDVGYIEPLQFQNFITIASISMTEDKEIQKEVIVGNGQNVYVSMNNLYIAQTEYPRYNRIGKLVDDFQEKTVITKFSLNDGKIKFAGNGNVPGHILNQFSMDEYDGHFRIATTKGSKWGDEKSTNNVYVLDIELEITGKVEDLAPGERIYSVRFMGKRGYVVTFKKVDPLFVIDLDPRNPEVLGKLKIPGYSDYLHPYDENHIIGIGKDTVEASDDLKTGRDLDFAWYQGIKMAIFDVSDVENPKEMHKVIIGDRGTESEALRDHKAFLFDREKGLLVIPVLIAKIEGERTIPNQYGEYIFQGAYVFDIGLKKGFDLRGKITHHDDDDAYKKTSIYFGGHASIRRSLYIKDVLYTFSNKRLQLNNLDSLEKLKVLKFEPEYQQPDIIY